MNAGGKVIALRVFPRKRQFYPTAFVVCLSLIRASVRTVVTHASKHVRPMPLPSTPAPSKSIWAAAFFALIAPKHAQAEPFTAAQITGLPLILAKR
jgi:hypothetical protein